MAKRRPQSISVWDLQAPGNGSCWWMLIRRAACVEQLENTRVQLENAKAEVQKPFPQEEELAAKTARLNELNALLNLDKTENEIVDGERADEEPSRSSDDRER